MNSSMLKNLENIFDIELENFPLPYVKGNSIRIKHLVVRGSKAGWLVYNSNLHRQVARLYYKASALALAKSLAEGRNKRKQIQELDNLIQKNYNDCIFYRNTLNNCTDSVRRAITQNRLELCVASTKKAKQSLDSIIFYR